jgi:hypothetical protein
MDETLPARTKGLTSTKIRSVRFRIYVHLAFLGVFHIALALVLVLRLGAVQTLRLRARVRPRRADCRLVVRRRARLGIPEVGLGLRRVVRVRRRERLLPVGPRRPHVRRLEVRRVRGRGRQRGGAVTRRCRRRCGGDGDRRGLRLREDDEVLGVLLHLVRADHEREVVEKQELQLERVELCLG